mgnify:CR=1 FL=1
MRGHSAQCGVNQREELVSRATNEEVVAIELVVLERVQSEVGPVGDVGRTCGAVPCARQGEHAKEQDREHDQRLHPAGLVTHEAVADAIVDLHIVRDAQLGETRLELASLASLAEAAESQLWITA